jgi:hypothetical protein
MFGSSDESNAKIGFQTNDAFHQEIRGLIRLV